MIDLKENEKVIGTFLGAGGEAAVVIASPNPYDTYHRLSDSSRREAVFLDCSANLPDPKICVECRNCLIDGDVEIFVVPTSNSKFKNLCELSGFIPYEY